MKAPEVQRFLATQVPKPRRWAVVTMAVRRSWPALAIVALAAAMLVAARFKHWGA